jgi:hypothetical protein
MEFLMLGHDLRLSLGVTGGGRFWHSLFRG